VDADTYDAAVEEAAEYVTGVDSTDVDDDLDAWGAAADSLDANARIVEALRRSIEAQELADELRPLAVAQRVEESRATIREWQIEQGLTGAQARERLAAIEQATREDTGRELADFAAEDPATFANLLRAEGAALDAVSREFTAHEIRQGILDAPTTSVSDGLTQMTPWGSMKLQEVPELAPRQESIEAQAVAAARPRETAEQIKAGLLETPASSVAASLTDEDGNSTTAYRASGLEEQEKLEREMQRARDRGLLR
jgi:hypothetical protein